MLLAGASASLAAQSQDDSVRLDEFAVNKSADNSLQVQQVTTGADQVESPPQPHDHSVGTHDRSEASTQAVAQVSQNGHGIEQAQLSKPGATPDQSSAAVSSPDQSRPDGVQRLAGTDRCDPQLGDAERERCKHILELRAQEFHAPAPPQLSAEEKLLAEQRAAEETSRRSPDTRLRLASRDDPDAELESNQELAALYLQRQGPPPEPAPDKTAPPLDESLAKVLEALQIGGPPPQGSP